MDYQTFNEIFNRFVFGASKAKLLENIAENPERYLGIFRPTKPKTKLLQNLLTSHEIKFGDALERLIEQYLKEHNFSPLSKKIPYYNKDKEKMESLELDQLAKKDNTYYFIEQKMRDDHDSAKKRGQIDNFERKLEALIHRYGENIQGYFYFKDKNEAKERQDEKESLKAEIEKDKQDSNELKHSEIDTKDTSMSEPLETLDKDKQAMSEAIKKDIEKDKENLARVEADKKVKADESERGYEKDDDKKADKLDKEIAKDKASPNKDELYEEDDRVKRDKERDDALRDKEKAKDDACMVRADDDTIEDDEEYGDDTMSMKNKNNDEVNVIQEYKKIYDECEVTDKIKILGNIQKYQMDILKFRP